MLKRSIAISALLAALCGAAAPAQGAFEVDRGFGVDGVVEGRFGSSYRQIAFRSLQVQTDGSVQPGREPTPLDPEGKFAAAVHFKIEAVEPLASGGTLVGGPQLAYTQESGTTFNLGVEVARLDAEGRLDPSFGTDGIVRLGSERLLGLFAREGGGVGAVLLEKPEGYYGQADVHPGSTIVELDAQGNPNPGFGKQGTVRTPLTIEAFHLLEGGALMVTGEEWVGRVRDSDILRGDAFVGRFTPAGELDKSFGDGDGLVSLDLGSVDLVGAAIWGADGTVTIGGSSTRWEGSDCFPLTSWCTELPYVARFTAAGALDPGFGSGGVVELEGLSYPYARFEGGLGVLAMVARPGGGVYAAGGSGTVAFVAALTPAGGLDPGYGSGGIFIDSEPIESSSAASAVAIDSRGRLLVSGVTNAGLLDSLSESALFRYLPNGELDRSFSGGSGFLRLPEGGGYGIAIGPDDSAFVLTGWSVSKVSSSGQRDRSFGRGGIVELPAPRLRNGRGRREESYVELRSIAVLPHRRILVAGTAYKNESRAVVYRLRFDGSFDRSFGHGGKVVLGFGRTRQCQVEQMALQPDGRIVLAGLVEGRRDDHPGKTLAVMRLLQDGGKDPTFGRKGLVVRRAGRRSYATAVGVQGQDLLVAGRARSGAHVKEVLLRLRPDGSLDRGFAQRGTASSLLPLKPGGYTLRPRQILLSQGRILVLRDSPRRPLVAYSADGRHPHAFEVARAAETTRGAARAPFGALQGNRLVLGWDAATVPRRFKLQRLRIDAAP